MTGVQTCALPISGGRPDRKVGAVGIRVARGVTMHGIALNCDCDLSWYDRVVPCGISDARTTSLSAETGTGIGVPAVLPVIERHLADILGHGRSRPARLDDLLLPAAAAAS